MAHTDDSVPTTEDQRPGAASDPASVHGSCADDAECRTLEAIVTALRQGAAWSEHRDHAFALLAALDPVDRGHPFTALATATKAERRELKRQFAAWQAARAETAAEPELEDVPDTSDDADATATVPPRPGTRCFWRSWRFQGEPAGSTRPPGIWRVTTSTRDGVKAHHVAGPARVVATVASPDGQDHGAVVEFIPMDGGPRRQVIVDHATRVADPRAVGALLASRGLLVVDPVELGRFLAYPPREPRRAVLARKAGWLVAGDRRAFVTRSGAVVGPLGAVAGPELVAPEPKGTLADWRERIAAPAVDNSLLALALATALAGPLVRLLDRPNVGAVFIGPSSTGKTSVAYAAASVWGPDAAGNALRTWNATANGLAAAAAEANDTALVLDEMGAADAHAIQRIIFDLAGEAGRSRARRDGTAAPVTNWRGTFLATSERPVEAVAGRRLPEGIRGRLVELRVDGRHGAFDTLHGYASGAALADALRAAARECHGTAGPAFVAHLLELDLEDTKRRFRRLEDELGPAENGLEARVRSGLALVALAGELATEADVLPWAPDEAVRAARWAYERWRGDAEPSERARICQAVRDFIDAHGASRFAPVADPDVLVRDRAGWRQSPTEYLFTRAGLAEATCGFDLRRALEELKTAGWLLTEGDDRYRSRRWIGSERRSVYVVRIPADE